LIFEKHKLLREKERNVIFRGRLADYKYYDRHHVIEIVLAKFEKEINCKCY